MTFAQKVLARAAGPEVALYVNDYGILSSGGWDVVHQQGYRRIIELLVSGGAPLEGIGLQGHFNGGQMTDIERVVEVLDRFGSYGKDLLVTEFTFEMDDEDLQAEFTRDFLTAAFSHPSVKGFYNWNFREGDGAKPNTAMYRC